MFIGIIILCCIVLALYIKSWYEASNIRKLASEGWVFYHSPSCGYCVKQIVSVGKSRLGWMPMVDCSKSEKLCAEKNISAFPTWLNEKSGKIHVGAILLEEGEDDSKLVDVLSRATIINLEKTHENVFR